MVVGIGSGQPTKVLCRLHELWTAFHLGQSLFAGNWSAHKRGTRFNSVRMGRWCISAFHEKTVIIIVVVVVVVVAIIVLVEADIGNCVRHVDVDDTAVVS